MRNSRRYEYRPRKHPWGTIDLFYLISLFERTGHLAQKLSSGNPFFDLSTENF